MELTREQAIAALEGAKAEYLVTRKWSDEMRANLASAMEHVLATRRVLLPWRVRDAAKRQRLPYQNRLLQADLLELCCKYGEGRLALTYLLQELRDKGWRLPSRWDEQMDLISDHGFKMVRDDNTRKYAYYLAMA